MLFSASSFLPEESVPADDCLFELPQPVRISPTLTLPTHASKSLLFNLITTPRIHQLTSPRPIHLWPAQSTQLGFISSLSVPSVVNISETIICFQHDGQGNRA